MESCEFGIIANYRGDSYVRKGAKCYVTWLNPGNAGNRVQVWVKSRSGRPIVRIVNTKRLYNFRSSWIPEHIRNWQGVFYARFGDKDAASVAAQILADRYEQQV